MSTKREDAETLKARVTKDLIEKAIECVNEDEHLAVDGCRYEIVSGEDMYEESIKHSAEHMYPDEPLCSSLGMVMDDEVRAMSMVPLLQNMTIVLVATKTREIIGQRVISTMSINDKIELDQIQVPANNKFLKLYDTINKSCDFWKHYNVEEAFHFFGLSVHREYRRKGIGTKLMQAALLFIKSMNLGPVLVKALGDSIYSHRIFERTEFDCLGEIMYDDYKNDGEQVVTNTGEHKSIKLFCKMI